MFDAFIPLDDAARDGGSQLIGCPKTGDMAAAWWTGDMWSEIYPNSKGDIDRKRMIQTQFEPTHYRPVAKRLAA